MIDSRGGKVFQSGAMCSILENRYKKRYKCRDLNYLSIFVYALVIEINSRQERQKAQGVVHVTLLVTFHVTTLHYALLKDYILSLFP